MIEAVQGYAGVKLSKIGPSESRMVNNPGTSVQWRIIWKKTMENSETVRRELENINDELEHIRYTLNETNIELDKERLAIEKSHRIKGPVYEEEIRIWMKKVDGQYFFNLENKLFRGYEKYMTGVRKYINFIERAIIKCHERNYIEPINKQAESMVGFPLEDPFRYDYAQFEKKRNRLEDEWEEYEKRMNILEENRRSVEQRYAECTSVQWRIIWKKTMENAEKARRDLEDVNDELDRFRGTLNEKNVELDKERLAIKKSHKIKGPVYEEEIRIWMKKFDSQYFSNLENILFRGYEEYMNGIRKYISFVEGAMTKCHERKYIEPITEAVLNLIPEITSGIKSIMDILRKDR